MSPVILVLLNNILFLIFQILHSSYARYDYIILAVSLSHPAFCVQKEATISWYHSAIIVILVSGVHGLQCWGIDSYWIWLKRGSCNSEDRIYESASHQVALSMFKCLFWYDIVWVTSFNSCLSLILPAIQVL